MLFHNLEMHLMDFVTANHGIDYAENKKAKVLEAYLYWDFFVRCIYSIVACSRY